MIFVLAVVFLAVIVAVSYYVFDRIFTVKTEQKTYFAVCFYEGTDRKEAESVKASLLLSGGSGYIVNDGKFLVFGAVYSDVLQAESVAKKQQGEAFVKEVGWTGVSVKCSSYEDAKSIAEGLNGFDESLDFLIKLSLSLDLYEENDASVYLQIENISDKFYQFSKNIKNQKLADFFETCYNVVKNDFLENDEGKVSSRLKYVIHELIEFRSKVEI